MLGNMESLQLKNYIELQKLLGKRIKNYRLDIGWSQKDLSKMSGVSVHTISNVENGNGLTICILVSLLRALNLLDNFGLLVPEVGINPFDVVKRVNNRQRVYRKRNNGTNK